MPMRRTAFVGKLASGSLIPAAIAAASVAAASLAAASVAAASVAALISLAACGSSGRDALDAGVPDDALDAGSSNVCGGIAHLACGPTEYCDYANDRCGVADQTGSCKTRPVACPAIIVVPTCACNGKVYAGTCDAFLDGVDLDASGTCPVPAGKFACGYTQCVLATQYCRREPHTGAADTFVCASLPSACSGTPACDCLSAERCGDSCGGDARVGLTLTCPAT
jgi:hypothetical protein